MTRKGEGEKIFLTRFCWIWQEANTSLGVTKDSPSPGGPGPGVLSPGAQQRGLSAGGQPEDVVALGAWPEGND